MFSLILTLLFGLALALFAVENTAGVQLQFLWWKSQNFPLSILVIASATVGVVLSFLLSLPTHNNRKKQLKQKDKELSQLRDAIGKH